LGKGLSDWCLQSQKRRESGGQVSILFFVFIFFLVFPVAETMKIRLQRSLENSPVYVQSPGAQSEFDRGSGWIGKTNER
jgi:hypothetical protein